MTTTTYSLDEFVSGMESLLKDQPDQQKSSTAALLFFPALLGIPMPFPPNTGFPWAKAHEPTTARICSTMAKADCWSPLLSGDPATMPRPMTTGPGA